MGMANRVAREHNKRSILGARNHDEGGTGEEVRARLNGWDGSSASHGSALTWTASSTSASSLLEGDLRFLPPAVRAGGGESVGPRRTGEPFGFRVAESGVPDRERGEREVGVRIA